MLCTTHGTTNAALDASISRLRACFDRHGLQVVTEQRGERLPDRQEHFGYADGVGQPSVSGNGDLAFGEGDVGMFQRWHGLPVGEIFHGRVDADGYPASGPAAPFHVDGTYKVWRKLHEDVATFRTWVADQAERLDMDELLLRAKLVGRWPDASPLALTPHHPDPAMGLDPARVNAFDYSDDPEGIHCPLGAHIRRTNPRAGLGAGDALTARQRIIRRGMTYGPALPDGAPDDGADRGIYFVAYMADIERQYEFIQANWCNDGDAVRVGHDRDPFVGRADGDHKFTIPGPVPKFVHPLAEVVTTRGGEYLWTPSIAALHALATSTWIEKTPAGSTRDAGERAAGTALGTLLAPVAATIGFARGKRAVHPVGAAFEAVVVVDPEPPDIVAGTVLGRQGTYAAVARLSRGFGIPLRWSDVHGIAIHIFDADGAGATQDLLLATSKRKTSGRDATAVTPRYERVFSSMLHLRSPGGELVARAWPVQEMPHDATVHAGVAGEWKFTIGVAPPGGEFAPAAHLTLGSPLSREATEALTFNLSNDGGGLEPVGLLNHARPIVYRASQAGRGARRRLGAG
jgi:Dyp-type peroxidase family